MTQLDRNRQPQVPYLEDFTSFEEFTGFVEQLDTLIDDCKARGYPKSKLIGLIDDLYPDDQLDDQPQPGGSVE